MVNADSAALVTAATGLVTALGGCFAAASTLIVLLRRWLPTRKFSDDGKPAPVDLVNHHRHRKP